MNENALRYSPCLPGFLKLPLKVVPVRLRSQLFVRVLNSLFVEELKEDELDFMQGRTVVIQVIDADMKVGFSLHEHRFVTADALAKVDLQISGSLYDFLLLASRREDPDTLFFNRRLKLSGDTELGLYVKNFLDSVDLTERFKWLHQASIGASRVAERFSLK